MATADRVLLVDAANVVGARPDGWWRDRAGAARRLVDRLAALPPDALRRLAPAPAAPGLADQARAAGRAASDHSTIGGSGAGGARPQVLVVLEGQARAGVPEASHGSVRVVHAPGSGDDVLAAHCAPGVLLVTADRELAARARARGAEVAGPRALLDRLTECSPRSGG